MCERLGRGIACLMGSIGGGCCCKVTRMVPPSGYSGDGYNFNRRSSGTSREDDKRPSTYKIQGGVQASLTPYQ